MKLAILFWFYKEIDVCENRLKLLKKFNPELQIFGLFGGEISQAERYKTILDRYLDDFYIFDQNKDSSWKWINGDLMILDWYKKRGKNLDWDSVVVAQWDILIFDSIKNQLPKLEKNQIFLSGLRDLDREVEDVWDWTMRGSKERKNYLNFIRYLKEKYEYSKRLLCCLFILQVFPRVFFDQYLSVEDLEIGMLEYKIPTYAKIFGLKFYEKDLGVRWFGDQVRPLNAVPEEIDSNYIKSELAQDSGWRIFHPYYKKWDI